MELDIKFVPFEANQYDVTRAIAAVLHNEFPKLTSPENPRKLNFRVTLKDGCGGLRNNGQGTLTLPSRKAGQALLAWLHQDNFIKVNGKKLRFFPIRGPPNKGLKMILQKAPYIDPDIDEKRKTTLSNLDRALRIDEVQFGVFVDPKGPGPTLPRCFSIEWRKTYTETLALLRIEYAHKLIRIQLGSDMTEALGFCIAVPFTSIDKVEVGYDFGRPSIYFRLLTPPIVEEFDFNRQITGDEFQDNRKFRRRVGSLNPGHAYVAPYAHQLRVLLYSDNSNEDVLQVFAKLCRDAFLRPPHSSASELQVLGLPASPELEASALGMFTERSLNRLRKWFKDLQWEVAFQLETLLHNNLLNTEDLLKDLADPIRAICGQHVENASDILRCFVHALSSPTRPQKETNRECLERVRREKLGTTAIELPFGTFQCHHVTFTPTRILLEGPYIIQSNRCIRQYPGFEQNFIRVDFRDEDRLQFRWDREVDGTSFLEERVGGTLKYGFELAGRNFEFLAYSSSALREHAVWFMCPFTYTKPDGNVVYVTSDSIRQSLGAFSGELICQPSKYAARLAQAFTATDSSIKISKDQWKEVPDLGRKPFEFTDGCGTISRMLGDKIWQALCLPRGDQEDREIQPSAYQIRFLGYKGMVSVDEQLEDIKMHLRPSMHKFDVNGDGDADIEIARDFKRPNLSSLVMILEDRGVRLEAFLSLQESAVADAHRIDDSIDEFCNVLKGHTLGSGYRLTTMLEGLKALGLDLKACGGTEVADTPFLRRVRHFAKNHVLRDIKHGARIPVPNSWLLVGVADEGPAYVEAGFKNVFCLPAGKIYACIQNPEDTEPTWIKGRCLLYRSPVVHPGDVQGVYAIGKPPEDQLCLFRHLKNVVVLPSVGERSLASGSGGGDVDGDLFDVVQCAKILPPDHVEPALYPPGDVLTLPRESTIEDVCDFVVQYINSDVLGLLSDRHLIIADQSKSGTLDERCLELARLCSQAVDYPKNGIPVNIDRSPRWLIPYKPDWHAAEDSNPRGQDYYESTRALGYLYRAIIIEDPSAVNPTLDNSTSRVPLTDPISSALKKRVNRHLSSGDGPPKPSDEIETLFRGYADELEYICSTHTVSVARGTRLREEEIVVGTIMAKCSQKRWRKDRIYAMRIHASALVKDTQNKLLQVTKLEEASEDDLVKGLGRAWCAWDWSLSNTLKFGANSFGLISLNVMFDCLEKLENIF